MPHHQSFHLAKVLQAHPSWVAFAFAIGLPLSVSAQEGSIGPPEVTHQLNGEKPSFLNTLISPAEISQALNNLNNSPTLMSKMPFLPGMTVHSGQWSLELAPEPIRRAVASGVITESQAQFSFEQQKKFYEWTQENPNHRYLFVNVPTFDLSLYGSPSGASTPLHRYSEVWSEKAIVGRKSFEPKEKSLNVVSLKYNPTWTPTASAVRRNVLNADGDWNWDWIDKHDFIPHSRHTETAITWVEATQMPIDSIYLVEPSGPKNTLGSIKFETDSNYYIYLHDTNAPWYFERNNRAISTGCVRVADPKGLAAALLNQSVEYVDSQINTGRMFWERIQSVPLYFMYDIVEYDNDGQVLGMSHDPYGHFESWLERPPEAAGGMTEFDYDVRKMVW